MDALVPLASAPTAIVGRNRIWRKALMDSIRDDPHFAGGEYEETPREGLRDAHRPARADRLTDFLTLLQLHQDRAGLMQALDAKQLGHGGDALARVLLSALTPTE
jgi:homoserine acetyltransferase